MDDDKAREALLTWTPEAQARLQRAPEGVMRELTRQRVETLARQRGQSTVTLELLETKYQQWAEGSAPAARQMTWTDQARKRMQRVPAFVRGMVVKAIEAHAQHQGLTEITPKIVDEAKGFWGETGRFHQP